MNPSTARTLVWLALAAVLVPGSARAQEASITEAGLRAVSAAALQRVPVKDSVRNGALIGLVAGAATGAVFGVGWKQYCENEATSCPEAPVLWAALFGGLGAGIGAGIDGLIHRTPYLPHQQGKLTLVPVVDRNRHGMLASIRF